MNIPQLHLKLQWENKAKEDYKPEKKVADLHWPRTDSIHINYKRVYKIVWYFANACFYYVLAQEKKMEVAKKDLT